MAFIQYATDLTFEYVPVGLNVSSIFPCRRQPLVQQRYAERTFPFHVNVGCAPSVFDTEFLSLLDDRAILNRSTSTARSKRASLTAFQAAGITTPLLYDSPIEAMLAGPFLGRSDHGRDSQGIVYYESYNSWVEAGEPQHDLYVSYLDRRREMRAHVMFGEVFAHQLKYYDDDSTVGSAWGNCRMRWHQSFRQYLTEREQTRAYELAIAAVDAVGLDFGAVDLFLDTSRNLYVLEVNTAPALDMPRIRNDYIEAFRRVSRAWSE